MQKLILFTQCYHNIVCPSLSSKLKSFFFQTNQINKSFCWPICTTLFLQTPFRPIFIFKINFIVQSFNITKPCFNYTNTFIFIMIRTNPIRIKSIQLKVSNYIIIYQTYVIRYQKANTNHNVILSFG